MDQYIVLIADVEGSKQLKQPERKAAQEKLREILRQLNEQDTSIVSQYAITLGDEFQAVFSSANHLFNDIWTILAKLNPVKVRFSVAAGTIATSIQKEKVLAMDGPAFHTARDGIERMKKDESLFRIALQKQDSSETGIINDSLALLSIQIRSWNANRVVMQHLMRQGMNYKEISKRLEISERAFYKNKEAGSLDLVNSLLNGIQDYINTKLAE